IPRSTVSPAFLFAYTFIPLAAIFLFSLWKPLYHVRYIFTSSPAFSILVAFALYAGVSYLLVRREKMPKPLAIGAGAFAMVLSILFLGTTIYSLNNFWNDSQYADDDLRGAVGFIADHWRPGDVILVNAGYAYPAIAYYFPEETMRERLPNYQSADGVS